MTSANHPMAWAEEGACRGEDQALFFPPVDITRDHVDRVRPICQACRVFVECHTWALANETEGIWAATSPKDRRRLDASMGMRDISRTVDALAHDVHVGLVPDVAELTADGRSAAEIASILGIDPRTVTRHRARARKTA